jgi:ankyrin repeat protein
MYPMDSLTSSLNFNRCEKALDYLDQSLLFQYFQGNQDIVKELLTDKRLSLEQSFQDSNSTTFNIQEPASLLIEICSRRDLSILNLLLTEKSFQDSPQKWLVLFYACSVGDLELAKLFLSSQTSEKVLTHDGFSPLIVGCSKGHLPIVQLLLQDPRIDPNFVDRNHVIAITATHEPSILQALLSHPKININQPLISGMSPAQFFLSRNHNTLFKLLFLNQKFDLNSGTIQGQINYVGTDGLFHLFYRYLIQSVLQQSATPTGEALEASDLKKKNWKETLLCFPLVLQDSRIVKLPLEIPALISLSVTLSAAFPTTELLEMLIATTAVRSNCRSLIAKELKVLEGKMNLSVDTNGRNDTFCQEKLSILKDYFRHPEVIGDKYAFRYSFNNFSQKYQILSWTVLLQQKIYLLIPSASSEDPEEKNRLDHACRFFRIAQQLPEDILSLLYYRFHDRSRDFLTPTAFEYIFVHSNQRVQDPLLP